MTHNSWSGNKLQPKETDLVVNGGVLGAFTLNSGGALAWEPGNRGQTKGGGERMRGDPFGHVPQTSQPIADAKDAFLIPSSPEEKLVLRQSIFARSCLLLIKQIIWYILDLSLTISFLKQDKRSNKLLLWDQILTFSNSSQIWRRWKSRENGVLLSYYL